MKISLTTPVRPIIFAGTLLCLCQPASANLDVRFVESAPKDWFSLSNSGECAFKEITMTIDLSNTTGQLIFDTTATGAGVEVFQPFEIREGDITLSSASTVNDGDNVLSVLIKQLAPGQSVSFTIDVDDTLPKSALGNIRVADAEIAGGTVSLGIDSKPQILGTFDNNAEIRFASPEC